MLNIDHRQHAALQTHSTRDSVIGNQLLVMCVEGRLRLTSRHLTGFELEFRTVEPVIRRLERTH